MLYPPLYFRRVDEQAPAALKDAEFYQSTLLAALYVVEDPDDDDFGWVGWDLPQLGEGQWELALEAVLALVAEEDRPYVVSRSEACLSYAFAFASQHRDPERVRTMAYYYRRVLSRYAHGGLPALGDAPLRPSIEEERERRRLSR